jgi:hypothetical protein
MSYTVKKLPNEPIVLAVVDPDYVATAEAEQFLQDILKTLDAQGELVYLVFDSSPASITLDDLLQGVRLATQQQQLFKHPKLCEGIMVTPSRLMKLVVQGLNNPIFGNLSIHQAESLEAALAYARTQASLQS